MHHGLSSGRARISLAVLLALAARHPPTWADTSQLLETWSSIVGPRGSALYTARYTRKGHAISPTAKIMAGTTVEELKCVA
jgi:hypothetical protein